MIGTGLAIKLGQSRIPKDAEWIEADRSVVGKEQGSGRDMALLSD
jgi:hypothetical protein